MAALLAISVSASLARRRLRPNQAKLRSTTQRLGRRTKPRAVSERLTTVSSSRSSRAAVARPRPDSRRRRRSGRERGSGGGCA